MNEEKGATKKSSRGVTQKTPGEKLKSETSASEAMRKKLRYGKKDNSLTVEQHKKIKAERQRGRKLVYAEASARRGMQETVDKQNEDGNVGTEALSRGSETVGFAGEKVRSELYQTKLHRKNEETRKVEHSKKQTSNAKSKAMQKSKMKKDMVRAQQNKKAAEAGKKAAKKGGDMISRVGKFIVSTVAKNPKILIVVGVIALIIILIVCLFSSCSMMTGTVSNVTIATSYTADDDDILAVEAAYSQLEAELQEQVNSIETVHPDYDEYRYNLAEINHNPYQLAAILTVLYEDYTLHEVEGFLQTLFTSQYELVSRRIVETRTRLELRTRMEERSRIETRTGVREVWDEESQSYVEEEYTYEVVVTYWVEIEYYEPVEYEYYILETTLTNVTMDAVVRSLGLSADQMERYELLLETCGNKAYLFGDDIYSAPDPGEYPDYQVPAEHLTNEQFRRMIQCAEQYLGYPYVWGGSSPETSFDCSGYVSYVINNCGNGWSVGRQTANGLLGCCTAISPTEAKPGDLIFFQGTYNTRGASHVGIYVGDGMMIHCGNPIQYASVNTSYWQEHFYTYGRIN